MKNKKLVQIIRVYSDGSTLITHPDIDYKDVPEKPNFKKTFEEYIWPNPSYPFPLPKISNNCPKCGMNLDGMTGYVCGQYACPVFLQVYCGV